GYAWDALTEPREGTILSVIRDFGAELAAQLAAGAQDFTTLMEHGLARAQQSLAATTAQLEALRRANVVDAGAQGFVDLLQGITDYVRDGSLRTGPAGGAAPAVPDAASPASFSAA